MYSRLSPRHGGIVKHDEEARGGRVERTGRDLGKYGVPPPPPRERENLIRLAAAAAVTAAVQGR